MLISFKKLREQLSEMSPRDLVYPGIILMFIIIVIILFFLSTKFLSKNINNAFTEDVGSDVGSLNMGNYAMVAKKLGVNSGTNNTTASGTPAFHNEIAEVVTPVSTQPVDKNSLSLKILNGTNKKGIAGELALALESAGYAKATTGNQVDLATKTTIAIKETRASLGTAILEEVKKLYPTATATTTADTAPYDVVITIGSN